MSKKKIFYISITIFLLIFIYSFGNYITGNYDKQNKIVVFLKSIIPSSYAKKIRDTVFYVPKMRERNNYLELIVKKHEQGLKGEIKADKITINLITKSVAINMKNFDKKVEVTTY